MKIRLALLDNDVICLQKLCDAFSTKFSDKLELYAFSELDAAIDCVNTSGIDVFLARSTFDFEVNALPKSVGFAYLVDSKDIESYKDQRTVCRFQKAEDIYKMILDIYSTCCDTSVNKRFSDSKTLILCFTTPSVGTGSSTMAVSCATRLASMGQRVLYLDLQKLPTVDGFFPRGSSSLSDVIFAIKSKKVNLPVKLQSCVQEADSGVFYFSQVANALDILEVSDVEREQLIVTLQQSGEYDCIVIDVDFSFNKNDLNFIASADAIVYTCDGTENSIIKLSSYYQALSILEEQYSISMKDKTYVLYNKFSSKIGQVSTFDNWKNLGGIPKFEHATNSMIVDSVREKPIFDTLITVGGN